MRRCVATVWVTAVCACTTSYDAFHVAEGPGAAGASANGGGATSSTTTTASGSGGVGAGGASSSGGGIAGAPEGGGGGGGTGGQAPSCGDGSLAGSEECDDGNVVDGDGCDSGCVVECAGVKHPVTHHCYVVLPGDVNWDPGRASCLALGAGWDLAALTTAEEIAFADMMVPTVVDVWIGGNDIDTEGVFVWSNGEGWTDIGWLNGEPNNTGGTPGEDCVELDDQGGLNDSSCTAPRPVLCELLPAGAS